jgi:hypothetical protein
MGASRSRANFIFGFVQKKMNEMNRNLLAFLVPSFPKQQSKNYSSHSIAIQRYLPYQIWHKIWQRYGKAKYGMSMASDSLLRYIVT